MKVILVGGIDRLVPHYCRLAAEAGHELRVFSQGQAAMTSRFGDAEAFVVMTGMVSHSARDRAKSAADSLGVPFLQNHSPGLSAFRGALASL